MPTVCLFYGIKIELNWREHNPPHFHASYAEDEASYDMQTLEVLDGALPRRAHALVLEWAAKHRDELLENWDRVQAHESPQRIAPLS